MSLYKLTRATALGRGSPRERRQQLGGWKRSSTLTPSSAQRGRGCHTTNRRDDWPIDKPTRKEIVLLCRELSPDSAPDGLLPCDRAWFAAHPWADKYTRPMVFDEFYPPFRVYCPPGRPFCMWVVVTRYNSKAGRARQPLAVPVGECPRLVCQ
jgi:hypothetical protein